MATKTPAQKAAEAFAKAQKAAPKPAPSPKFAPAKPGATAPAKGKPLAAAATPAPAAKPPAAPPAGTAAPAAPVAVDPFFTADDLDAINQFTTDLATKLEGIDFGLKNAEIDTKDQKTRNETSAQSASSNAVDDSIGRGIFQSSIKDATLYDIEAQRSLSAKFLDDKLTAQRLTAGTNKQILGTAKEGFDKNMATRKVQNAQGVNDANNTAWAAAKAAWDAANPTPAPITGPAPTPVAQPAGATGPPKGLVQPPSTANTLFAPTPSATPEKFGGPKPGAKPKVKTTRVTYGPGTA